MKTVYIDYVDFKCHTVQNAEETLIPYETEFFDGKCDTFINGYRIIPDGYIWTRSDGTVFQGEMIAPLKPYAELDEAQRGYEKQMLTEATQKIKELETMQEELNESYTEGVNSI